MTAGRTGARLESAGLALRLAADDVRKAGYRPFSMSAW
jgi:hypothetical protein